MSPRVVCSNCGGSHPSYDCKRPAQKSAPVVVEKPATLTRAQALKMQASILASGVIVSANPKQIKAKKPKSAIVALPDGRLEHTTLEDASSPSGKAPGFDPGTVGSNPAEATKPKRGRPSTGYDKRKADRERARAKRAAAKAAKP